MTEARRFPCEGAAGPARFHDLAGRRDDAAARARGVLDIWTFGDTTAFVRQADGIVRTIGEAPELRVAESAKAAEFLEATGATPKTLLTTPVVRQWLKDRREQRRAGEARPCSA